MSGVIQLAIKDLLATSFASLYLVTTFGYRYDMHYQQFDIRKCFKNAPNAPASSGLIFDGSTSEAFLRLVCRVGLVCRPRLLLSDIASPVSCSTNNLRDGIYSMNAVAERLTGWRASETAGRPLRTVFHIVHESSRNDVLEPGNADRNQFMISVPDRSMLVSRDGKEYPIETSISLIKEASKVYGVVLVFRDVSAQRQHQREMEETARRLREIAGERQVLLNREQAARAQAEAANQMKDDFLAMVSHELRTPLTSIMGWVAILPLSTRS